MSSNTTPVTRAGSRNWRTKPIQHPSSAPWAVTVSHQDLTRLIMGFHPQAMEDKWMIASDDPHERGLIKVHFWRSWTGHERAAVSVQLILDADGTVRLNTEAKIVRIEWETRDEADKGERSEKEIALQVCNWVLGCALVDDAS